VTVPTPFNAERIAAICTSTSIWLLTLSGLARWAMNFGQAGYNNGDIHPSAQPHPGNLP
jgi:hypothetical protein